MKKFRSHGIEFVGGYLCWSNPSLVDTEHYIPIALIRPCLLDLIDLSIKFGVDRLINKNNELLNSGSISKHVFMQNAKRLSVIHGSLEKC